MIRIGILHSLTGTMSLSEVALVQAAKIAIKEINQSGGVLGEELESVIVDGASTPEEFAKKARQLMDMGINTIFGCWTSASRKAVKEIIQGSNTQLWYPVQYEGLEQTPNIYYTGSTLNQQIEPAVNWCLERQGKRFFLLGSDYVFPRTANRLVRTLVEQAEGQIVGEAYHSLGDKSFSDTLKQIRVTKPDIVFNSLNGDSNIAFYNQLRTNHMYADNFPTMAVSIGEVEANVMRKDISGHYACWSYFQTSHKHKNQMFVKKFQNHSGSDSTVTSAPVTAAYSQLHLWAKAVNLAGSIDRERVHMALKDVSFDSPAGEFRITENNHVPLNALIGKAGAEGQFEIVWESAETIEPLPWLGLEHMDLSSSRLIKELMAELPQNINYSLSLEHEINERQRLEGIANISLSRMNEAQQMAHFGSWELDLKTDELWWSDEVYRIFGMAPEKFDASYDAFLNAIHPDDRELVNNAYVSSLETKLPYEIVHRLQMPDKTVKHVQEKCSTFYDNDGVAIRSVGTIQDITERVEAEQEQLKFQHQLEHTQRLESLGVLAGGIAHDFNNILTAILGNAAMAERKALLNPGITQKHLSSIVTSCERAADLCRQMLAYSGKGKFVIKAVDLSSMVEETFRLLDASIANGAILKYELAENLPAVEADIVQIQQVIMNLVINASDAISKKSGVISINTGVMHATRDYLKGTSLDDSLPEGRYVFLEVSDTGIGMDKEAQSRIFEPFFTTKMAGHGLGMSAVQGIIRGHKGAIKVYSEPGKGTTIKVLLPISDILMESCKNSSSTAATCRSTLFKGTVLIVDDEETIRETAGMMLEDMGFDILTAIDGKDGVEVYKKHQSEITLVLMDMTMPRMDGKTCFRELRCLNRDVKVILSSGYNEQEATSLFAGKGLAGFIQKPYTPDLLEQTVQNILMPPDN